MMKYFSVLALTCFTLFACKSTPDLPDYGEVNIPGAYTNQLGNEVSGSDLEGKVIVADFIFTHCPSICIPMAGQMKRIQNEYSKNDNLHLVSFSIDPENDTVERLRWYADKIGANNDQWWFLRADMTQIRAASDEFKVFQEADADAPGGFNHQSWFVLIDENGHMRGSFDGTNADEVGELMEAIDQLL